MSAQKTPAHILSMDVESTGLSPTNNHLLEVAWRLTEFAYPWEPVPGGSGSVLVVGGEGARQLLEGKLVPRVQEMHQKSGLYAAHRRAAAGQLGPGEEALTLAELEERLLVLSRAWPFGPESDRDERVVMGGYSVGQFDLPFVRHHLPTFAERLSHRVFCATNLWLGCAALGARLPKTETPHRAADDLEASVVLARRCAEWMTSRSRPGAADMAHRLAQVSYAPTLSAEHVATLEEAVRFIEGA
jgi:oligoribonuclease (3'-5' exoribonuclease)